MRHLLTVLFLVLVASPVHAKPYTAERFDSRIEILTEGSLRVTETIIFRFESGTFKRVFRTIPTRNSDGVEFISASMDGVVLPDGNGPGTIKRRRQNGLRVEWLFAPTGPSTHTFVLTYRVAGVARRLDDGDAVGWVALPKEHDYRIEASTVEVILPVPLLSAPVVDVRRVAQHDLDQVDQRVIVQGNDIGKNGWIDVQLRFAQGAIIQHSPRWQQRKEEQRRYVVPSLIAGSVIVFAGFVLLFGLRQGYDSPPKDVPTPRTFNAPPDGLAPALAGTLVANGRPHVEHAMSALFGLAARGVVAIREEARGRLRGSQFSIALNRYSGRHPSAHEQALLDILFTSSNQTSIELNKARSLVVRRFAQFKDAVLAELRDAGMLDDGRRRIQRRYFVVAGVLAAIAVVAMVPVIALIQVYGPAPMLVSAGIGIVALASGVYGSAHTPLSNEGVRRAETWRAFQKHLRDVAKDGVARQDWFSAQSPMDLLPTAIALGHASSWAKLFKARGIPLPSWFQAASHSDPQTGFVAFVAYGGGGAGHGGGAPGASASAGGGSSGAS
ncbi:hypothetical protein BH18ACI5_BH18ACI5_02060 [soil metagenome]